MNKLAKLSLLATLTAAILLTVTGTAVGKCTATCCGITDPLGTPACSCCQWGPDTIKMIGRDAVADPSPELYWQILMDPSTEKIASDSIPKDAPRILLFNSNDYDVKVSGSIFMLIPRSATGGAAEVREAVKLRSGEMLK